MRKSFVVVFMAVMVYVVVITTGSALLSWQASTQTNNLIASGKSPSAQRLAKAAFIDQQLLCAVLKPALTNPRVTPEAKLVIKKHCQ